MSYAGGNEIVTKSLILNDTIKEKLKSINSRSRYSIGSTNKNLHLYAPQANVLDGQFRICYIAGDSDSIIVSEYHNPRGDKYSALFHILADILYEKGIQSINNSKKGLSFKIVEGQLDLFVEACREVIELLEADCLILERSNEFFSINIRENGEKIDLYYYKFYYKIKKIINPYKIIAEEISQTKILKEIDQIIEKLSNLTALCNNKKNEINTIENI
jgi:hypothetical protein